MNGLVRNNWGQTLALWDHVPNGKGLTRVCLGSAGEIVDGDLDDAG